MENKTMTKSTITRERLQELAEGQSGFNLRIATHEESQELARIALAALDTEPVGEFYEDGPLNWYQISDGDRVPAHRRIPLYRHAQPVPVVEREPIAWLNDAYLARGVVDGEAGSEDAGPGYIPVYREAGPQPAPVVPEEKLIPNTLSMYAVDVVAAIAEVKGWNACRAATLAAAPQPQNAPQNIPDIIPNELIAAVNRLLDSNGSRGCYSAIKCYDAHIEVERLLAAARQEVKP
ncbi:hypothetical protein ACLHXR_21320 [Klebsiella quasipneumoniae]|uniref:hypothetical protein n=1 Tax=Klebsiella quasipneumoniae TaxID=1463165 RepID=UPI0039836F3C